MNISDLVRDVKNNSSNYINAHDWVKGRFSWQEGYGVFSYSHSQVDTVYQYIANQERHHSQKTFEEEYVYLLRESEVDFEEKYLFDGGQGQG